MKKSIYLIIGMTFTFSMSGISQLPNLKKGLEKTFLWYLNNNNYYKTISKADIEKRIGKI